jgi:hypothetical protein
LPFSLIFSIFSIILESVGVTVIHGGDNLVKYIQEVLNKTFQLHHIPDILKIGILFPVFKNKGDCKNAKNYRGITATPTLSQVIHKEVVMSFL